MGLFDFIKDEISDSISEKISDITGDVVEGVGDLFDDVNFSLSDGISKMIGRKKDTDMTYLSSNEFLGTENNRRQITESSLPKNSLNTIETKKIQSKKNNNNKRTASKITLTATQKLYCDLERSFKHEDRVLNELNNNGRNIFASLADTLFSEDKYTKTRRAVKSITGKTKQEKIVEAQIIIDTKRAKIFERVIPPNDPKELWEMFNLMYSVISKQHGPQTEIASKKLYCEVWKKCCLIFCNETEKMVIIEKYSPKDIDDKLI